MKNFDLLIPSLILKELIFSELCDFLSLRLAAPLPGAAAHDAMRAIPVGRLIPDFQHKIPPKRGSVLIALYDLNGVVHFPLIKRPDYTGAHSGQISLPGGKAEAGETVIDTALREGEEEIGISGTQLTVLGSLSEFFVIPSNFLVTPVVAVMHQVPKYVPDKREVARILEGNVAELVSESAVRVKEIIAAGMFQMRAPHFEIDGEVVWGATAMILNEFRTILREDVAR